MASILHSDFSPAFWCNSICSTKPLLVGHSQYTFKFWHIFIVKYSLITGKSAMKFFDKEMAVLFETFPKNHPFRTDLSFASFFSLRTWWHWQTGFCVPFMLDCKSWPKGHRLSILEPFKEEHKPDFRVNNLHLPTPAIQNTKLSVLRLSYHGSAFAVN